MATLFVDKVDPQSGTSLEIGSSGDTITVPSGATINVAGTLNKGGVAVANTPYFFAYLGSDTSLSNNTVTKAPINTEVIDSDGCYDNSTNYRFTPTTSGKYFVYGSARLNSNGGRTYAARTQITKNGSNVVGSQWNWHDSTSYTALPTVSAIVDMNGSSDYLELQVFMEWHTSQTLTLSNYLNGTYFGAYKLIG